MAQTMSTTTINVGHGSRDSGHISDCFKNTYTYNINAVDEKPELLRWLSPLEPQNRHQEVRVGRQDGIGTWLLKTDGFQEWRGRDGGVDKTVCFCHGDPGAGKTYLSSLVIDSLCGRAAEEGIAVAWLYCDYSDRHEQTTVNVIGAILKQLLDKDDDKDGRILGFLRKAKNTYGSRGLCLPDIVGMLKNAIALLPRVFVCIDAVDEFASKELPELLIRLSGLVRELPNLRLFLTGRFSVDGQVGRHFTKAVVIPISPEPRDIEAYLERRLLADPWYYAMDEILRADILRIAQGSISKSFLLVSLIMNALLREVTITSRKKKLNEMTNGNGLEGAYTTTLRRMREQDGNALKLGMDALMWVTCSKRPLRASELCHALGIVLGSAGLDQDNVPAMEAILGFSLGLVVLENPSSTVRLVHFTLREHLSKNILTLFGNPHSLIAGICLTYLNFPSVKELRLSLSSWSTAPLIGYASRYWERHARKGMAQNKKSLVPAMAQNVKPLVPALLDGFGQHISSRILLSYGDYPIELRLEQDRFGGFTCLHWAATLGMLEMTTVLLEVKKCDLNVIDMTGKTAIAWTARWGHTSILKALLAQEDIEPNLADDDGLTPLSFAAKYAREEIAKVLLEWQGINPDPVHKDGTTPLLLVAENWCVKILKMLLKREDVNPNVAKTGDGRTPLAWAAWRGDKEVVKILLERKDIKLDPTHPDGRIPILLAVSNGHMAVFDLLLERMDANFSSISSGGMPVAPPQPETWLILEIMFDFLVISVSLCIFVILGVVFLGWVFLSLSKFLLLAAGVGAGESSWIWTQRHMG